jgi:hypothetical protein
MKGNPGHAARTRFGWARALFVRYIRARYEPYRGMSAAARRQANDPELALSGSKEAGNLCRRERVDLGLRRRRQFDIISSGHIACDQVSALGVALRDAEAGLDVNDRAGLAAHPAFIQQGHLDPVP